MHEVNVDLLIVGAGPAGLAAAIAAAEAGAGEIVLVDRLAELGGILQQCIHNGFGLRFFKEELTGPEYAQRFMDKLTDFPQIRIKAETMVIEIAPDQRVTRVTTVNARDGLVIYNAAAIILAMGCRERPRGAINTPGTRPAGIYTAGSAQRLMNVEGFLPGRRAVILGSGDIGLIMARRLTLEGIKVEAVVELMPYSSGLTRNIVQCLDDFGIPLYLGHTVTEIVGRDRVEGVVVAPVDSTRVPDQKRAFRIDCDTLVLSVGLIPENELSLQASVLLDQATGGPVVDSDYQTSVPGIFACGNVVHVHDLVDDVSEESIVAGRSAAAFVNSRRDERDLCDRRDRRD
ncbi:MAG TPA: pyridine nucleotide-disulfide oxidoreductase, partial [Firmicutes bacterium]|nr:pyridine nucleotide-disulfide oxidoreductase [Bacillota bacterium]HBG43291.1 pyridine nucleotide-disulfide oxidoreductase [Bacillota bacterium]HCM18806.1 pyridine nucleotide-disulfide oxidoreductase [Bacillota bacterium]